jgi:hypothetical protein
MVYADNVNVSIIILNIEVPGTYIKYRRFIILMSINHVGILEYDTWRYYINQFSCSHFKGTGTEDNYYLFRPIYLNNGERVTSRKKFWLAHSENPLNHGTDYIISDHQAAVSVAKYLFHPELFTPEDYLFFEDYYLKTFLN